MYTPLIVMAGIVALIAGVVAWAMTQRYGRERTMVVPVLAVAAAGLSVFRAGGPDPGDALARVVLAMAFAGPAVAGALVGLVLARSSGR